MSRLTEILDAKVTVRDILIETGGVARATAVGLLKGVDALSKRNEKPGESDDDFGKRAAEAALIPLTSLFSSSRSAFNRLIGNSGKTDK